MGYTITDPSQIIDIQAVINGINQYKTVLQDLDSCGAAVIFAGGMLTKDALSIDDSTLEYSVSDLGDQIKSLYDTLVGYADDVLSQAEQVYRAQVMEYNDYVDRQQIAQQIKVIE